MLVEDAIAVRTVAQRGMTHEVRVWSSLLLRRQCTSANRFRLGKPRRISLVSDERSGV
jgi:hypothetical protein